MKDCSSPDLIPAAARAEAAAWVARLHGSDRTRALEAGLREWLNVSSVHAQAFELATEAWELGGSIPAGVLPRLTDPLTHRGFPTRSRRYVSIAAVLSAVAIGVLFHMSNIEPTVSTAVGEQRMVTLGDGSRIFLNTDTRLLVQEEPARRSVRLDSGEALFDVIKNPQRPFVVTAGGQQVLAVGTSFIVRRDAQRVTVTLAEGKVIVSPVTVDGEKDASATVLSPGQRLTITNRRPPQLDAPALEEVTAWRRGEVILDRTRLQDAVEEMNRYSAVRLSIENPATGDILISGIFRAGDSVRFAQAVGATYHLAIERQERQIVISGSPH